MPEDDSEATYRDTGYQGFKAVSIIPSEPKLSPLEVLAQAVLDNRVQIVSAARQGSYEIRVKPGGEQPNG